MAHHLRRFVTSPLPAFDYEFVSETSAPAPLAAAAKCLALCIKVWRSVLGPFDVLTLPRQLAPGDDLIMSNMYSLLNYIAATSKDTHDGSIAPQSLNNSAFSGSDHLTLHSVETGLRGYTEDERRLIGISTISVVSRLALEFQQEEVALSRFLCRGSTMLTTHLRSRNLRSRCWYRGCAPPIQPPKLPLLTTLWTWR